MSDGVRWVPFDVLEKFMKDVLMKMGVSEAEAVIVSDVLISSDKRGIDSHGIGRFKPIYIDRIDQGILETSTVIQVLREGPTTALIDAGNGFGHVAGKKAMEMAIEKAKAFGMGMVAVKNSSHYGFAGKYVLMATHAGMIGLTGTNARPSVAPTFGVENMLGTNPLTFGIPTDEAFDFVLDCATSTAQRGKIEQYAREGKELPEGWVVDANGDSMSDADEILEALLKGDVTLTPLGGIGEKMSGYKGYGYATVVEILSAALQSGPFLKALSGFDPQGNRTPYRLGHFFIAIDVENFVTLAEFRQTAGEILRQLRSSKKASGNETIYTAGEKEHLAWLDRENKGAPINQNLMSQLVELRDRFELTDYQFE